ncbi:NAD(P)-dependent oxidoreductase [Hydrogenophaga sp.]|uniref:NAD(P)-dependent oxidoreductase n=1 Tax=Hydrogenophaga sp. TaxID=1904254 RepID=UPI0027162924|nr:NAD(P)-dependent oxidoreductase [Hydrogenophaga sp.]MDO9437236.1 NAD(P)-dependent oxidoreductase [Hydrogenophaga sp.]
MEKERNGTVAFVGLGMMGTPMAENVLRKFSVVAYDIARDKVDGMVKLGALAASSPAEAAAGAGIQICVVETTAQAESVILGAGGFIDTAQPGDLVICMATIDWLAVKRIHAVLAEKGIDFVDAPVAGMRDNGGAKAASLKCFIGGDVAAVERAKPVLSTMCSEIVHFGAVGCGTAIKLLNSMVLQANRIVVAEAFAAGVKAGLDPERMFDLFSRSYANSSALQYDAPRYLTRNFDGIRMGITIKDVDLQLAFGNALGMPMPMVTQGRQVYQMAKAMGFEFEDAAAIVKVYERWTGVEVRGTSQQISKQS